MTNDKPVHRAVVNVNVSGAANPDPFLDFIAVDTVTR